MGRKKALAICSAPAGNGAGCRVESIVGVDERGQMVLPKELREKAGILEVVLMHLKITKSFDDCR